MRIGDLTALAGELVDVDPAAMSPAERHAEMVAIQQHKAVVAAYEARVGSVWDAERDWAADGSRSAAARLARDAHISPREAGAACRRGRKVHAMPLTSAALAEGSISPEAFDAIARCHHPLVADVFARDEAMLVGHAQTLHHADLIRVLEHWKLCADPDGQRSQAERDLQERHVEIVRTIDKVVHLDGRLDPVGGTAVLREHERLAEILFDQDLAEARERLGVQLVPLDALRRTPAQRRADALTWMAERSAALPGEHRGVDPLITVMVDYETFTTMLCQLDDGTVIGPDQIVPLLGRADVERIVFGSRNRILEVGRRERFFRGALRRAIIARDQHCQITPGCRVPGHKCQVDHIRPYAMGGDTTDTNGRLGCEGCNLGRNNRKDPPPDPSG